jgi:hypothetical protein
MGIFASKAIGSDDSFKIVDNSLTQGDSCLVSRFSNGGKE